MLLRQKLQAHFGYNEFRQGQREVIESVLSGNDTVALLPTGTGKSLCYQLPGYILQGTVVILSPLISLMQDQVDQLLMRGEKKVVAFNSFLNFEQKKYVLQQLHTYRFVFISPEMFLQEQVQERLRSIQISLIVADEAHCISQWGFDFRPDYLRVGEMLTAKRPPILALTATATSEVVSDIENYLRMKQVNRFISNVNRPNIFLSKLTFHKKNEKLEWLKSHVQKTAGPGIIYVSSRKKADDLSAQLGSEGLDVASYHGGKEAQDRQFIQEQFISGELDWIVATNAFGMGVHKDNVRQVIHETMPANVSSYMQEIGRAGRDGQQAVAILLYAEGDEQSAQYVALEDLPTAHHIELYEQYKAEGQLLDRLVNDGYMSSTQYRVLHYWLEQLDGNSVKERFLEMQQKKLKELQRMLQLVKGTSCLRAQVVAYFEQVFDEGQRNCCTNCGDDFSPFLLERYEKKENNPEDWKLRLQLLLKISR